MLITVFQGFRPKSVNRLVSFMMTVVHRSTGITVRPEMVPELMSDVKHILPQHKAT
jgi:hypothetical protein